jgi:hypothetical protein
MSTGGKKALGVDLAKSLAGLTALAAGITALGKTTGILDQMQRDHTVLSSIAFGLAILAGFGSNRIEALSVVLTSQSARDAVLPVALRGHDLEDPFVVDALERWASGQAASILAGIFLVAAIVMLVAVLPALAMGRRPAAAAAAEPLERTQGSLP